MLFRKAVVYALCLAVFNLGSPLVARAELVGTLQAVESGTRAAGPRDGQCGARASRKCASRWRRWASTPRTSMRASRA